MSDKWIAITVNDKPYDPWSYRDGTDEDLKDLRRDFASHAGRKGRRSTRNTSGHLHMTRNRKRGRPAGGEYIRRVTKTHHLSPEEIQAYAEERGLPVSEEILSAARRGEVEIKVSGPTEIDINPQPVSKQAESLSLLQKFKLYYRREVYPPGNISAGQYWRRRQKKRRRR